MGRVMRASTLLYVARHGETDWNASGRLQGHTDIPLNTMGRAQALKLAVRLRREGIVAIGSSDLARARETAQVVGRELGLPVTYTDARLRERGYGLFEGLTLEECKAQHLEHWQRFGDPESAPPGGESLEALASRMLAGALHAAEQLASPALLVSHGRAIRELASRVLRAPVPPVLNGGAYRFVVTDGALVEARRVEGA